MKAVLAALVAVLALGAGLDTDRKTIKLHFTPQDRTSGRYQYVPVDVPEGTTRLDIEYRYDDAGGANVLDLGLFEPGPLDLGSLSYRGWSGGERDRISVGVSSATPGYWPGAMPAGRWHVMLGLYKVADAGIDVEVIAQTSRAPEASPQPLPPRPTGPLRRGPAWYSGGLHLHTVHSDGKVSLAELLAGARADGLDFVAITDHNNTAHQTDVVAEEGLLRIVGEEVTTPGGHANVWGLGGWRDYVDFRVLPGDPRIADLVRAAATRGALFSINHPVLDCLACSWTHPIPDGVASIEVWNGPMGPQAEAIALWDRLLQQSRRLAAVGASDWHRPPAPIAAPSVRVWAPELSEAAVLAAIRDGRVVIMRDGRTPPPIVTVHAGQASAGVGETLAVRAGEEYAVEVTVGDRVYEGTQAQLFWNGAPAGTAPLAPGRPARLSGRAGAAGYLRVHVLDADGTTRALTNPVFLELRP